MIICKFECEVGISINNKETSSYRTTISMDISNDTELSIAHADLRHDMRALRRSREEDSEGPPVVHENFTTWRMTSVNRYDLDASVEPVTKKLREPTAKSVTKNRARRSANRLKNFTNDSEADTLRSELASVHKSYRQILQAKDEKIARDLEDYNDAVRQKDRLKIQIVARKAIIDDLENDLDITEGELTISQKSERAWIGRTLKLKFILDQIKKIGALPEDHASWVDPMIEDIDIPEVSIRVRDEFIPTAQTDNIDWTDEEEEYEEYETFYEDPDVVEASHISCTNCGEFGHVVGECLGRAQHQSWTLSGTAATTETAPRIDYSYPRAILEKSAKTIQKAWQIHQSRKKEQLDRELDDFMSRRVFNEWEWDSDGLHDGYAVSIQRVWRGHHLRKLLEAANNDRYVFIFPDPGRESMRAEALLAHNVFLHYSGVPFPAEQL